jgi:hypothetical protein
MMQCHQKGRLFHLLLQIASLLPSDDLACDLAVRRCVKCEVDRCIAPCSQAMGRDKISTQVLEMPLVTFATKYCYEVL